MTGAGRPSARPGPADGRPAIAVLVPLYGPALERLERAYTVHRAWTAEDPLAFLRDLPPTVEVLVTTGLAGFGPQHLDALPGVRLVAVFGVGHGTYDATTAAARGVVVTNTPDSTHATVAELAVGLLLAVSRRIVEADRFVRAGRWPDGSFPLGRGLAGARCGIVGLGRIGRHVATRLAPFGVELAYHGRRERPDAGLPFVADLVELAAASDVLVVTCPLTPATRGLVDARVLTALGRDGILVNVARGPIVDREALLEALRDGTIGGAGLDVFWDEPAVPADLLAHERVVLTPHLGTSTQGIRAERTELLLANLRAWFAGDPLPTPVSP